MTYTYTCPTCQHELTADFTPSRPAPVCSNPSSPAFSDPGDSAEFDNLPEECPQCGATIDIDKCIEDADQQAADQAYHDYNESSES